LLKDQLKPTIHHTAIIDYKLYSFYESIFIENRIDNDKEYCMKMMFLIKFKIYYNFIFENSDINNVETDECLDLIRVRDTFNRFNDTFQHIQYISKVKPEIDRLTHEIWTWIVFAIVTLVILYLYIQFEIYIKSINNQKRPKEIEMQEIVNEVVVDNNIEIPLQEAVEDIDDLNEIVTLDELVERKRTKIIDQDKKLSNKIIDKVTTNKEEINNLNDITTLDELIRKRKIRNQQKKIIDNSNNVEISTNKEEINNLDELVQNKIKPQETINGECIPDNARIPKNEESKDSDEIVLKKRLKKELKKLLKKYRNLRSIFLKS